MTTLENFYFGNINPSEYMQYMDIKKKLLEMTDLLDELKMKSLLTTVNIADEIEHLSRTS